MSICSWSREEITSVDPWGLATVLLVKWPRSYAGGLVLGGSEEQKKKWIGEGDLRSDPQLSRGDGR